jgi:hypothetical protein
MLSSSLLTFRGFILPLCYYNLFTYAGVQHHFHISWCSCRLTLWRQIPLMEQELHALPKHLQSPLSAGSQWSLCSCIFCFLCIVLWTTVFSFLLLYCLLHYPSFNMSLLTFLWTVHVYASFATLTCRKLKKKVVVLLRRYQRGKQHPQITEGQTTQWPKESGNKGNARSTKYTHTSKDRVTRTLNPKVIQSLLILPVVINHV